MYWPATYHPLPPPPFEITLLHSGRKEAPCTPLLVQIFHIEYLRKKKLQETILQILAEQGVCLTTAYNKADVHPHSKLWVQLEADQIFQWKAEKALRKPRAKWSRKKGGRVACG